MGRRSVKGDLWNDEKRKPNESENCFDTAIWAELKTTSGTELRLRDRYWKRNYPVSLLRRGRITVRMLYWLTKLRKLKVAHTQDLVLIQIAMCSDALPSCENCNSYNKVRARVTWPVVIRLPQLRKSADISLHLREFATLTLWDGATRKGNLPNRKVSASRSCVDLW